MTRLPRVSALTADSEGWGYFLCSQKELRPIRSGELLLVTLQDASGQINAKGPRRHPALQRRVRSW